MTTKGQTFNLEECDSIGPQWDALTEIQRLAQLEQLQIPGKVRYWSQLTHEERRKIYNAWRKWGARCE